MDAYEPLPDDDQDLILYLHLWASGMLHTGAAVHLLTEAHQHTFSRLLGDAQVRACLRKIRGKKIVTADWEALDTLANEAMRHQRELPARSAQVIAIACSLASPAMTPTWALTELLSGLDAMHTSLVLRAIQVHQGQSVQPAPRYVKN